MNLSLIFVVFAFVCATIAVFTPLNANFYNRLLAGALAFFFLSLIVPR